MTIAARSRTLALLFIAAIAANPIGARQQQQQAAPEQEKSTRQSREERIKAHEERIREIIRQRQEEAKKRAEERAKIEEAAKPPEGGAITSTGGGETQARALGAVLVYYNFPTPRHPNQLDTVVRAGSEFLSEIVVMNTSQSGIRHVRLALTYDKRFLKPVKIFDTKLRAEADIPPTISIDERSGVIHYNAALKNPIDLQELTALRIVWKALRPTAATPLNFAFSPEEKADEPHTAILAGAEGKNILGVGFDAIDGVLGANVTIEEDPATARPMQGKQSDLKQMYLGTIGAQAKAGMIIEPTKERIHVGDVFPIHIVLNNPDGAEIDSLDFMLEYPPAILEVVDKDRRNWIRRGVNAHDGPYHATYPFDYIKLNEARNSMGLLRYSVAMTEGDSLPTGRFATVWFRALAPTNEAKVQFLRSRPGELNLTSIRYFGFEMMDLQPPVSLPVALLSIANPPAGYQPRDYYAEAEKARHAETADKIADEPETDQNDATAADPDER